MVIPIKTSDPIRAYFDIVAPVFKLAPKEVAILTAFYRLDPVLPARPKDRKRVAEELGFKSTAGVNTYVSLFVKRGILIKDKPREYRFHPALKPPKKEPYSITFKVQLRNDQ